jgi:hypothetical protein
MTKICQLRKINCYGDLGCILMIVIESLKVLTPVLEPQIHGQMSFAFKIRWLMVILRTRDYYKGRSGKLRFIGSMLDVTDLKKPKKNSRMRIRWRQ